MARGAQFTLLQGVRKHTVSVLTSVTPEEILIWMSKAEMFFLVTGDENDMTALGKDVKDNMIKSNVG